MTNQPELISSFARGVLFIFTLTVTASDIPPAHAGGVSITNYGHSSLLIKGGGTSVLLNPFKAVGCAAGLKEPRIKANVILASSQLPDEGARVAEGIFLVQPGSYRIKGLTFEGFAAPHDRFGGRRHGIGTLWQWTQGGLRFAHLVGSGAPLKAEDRVLLGRPDVLIIAVGGGSKSYTGLEAANIINELRPKRVIPVLYSKGVNAAYCDQNTIQPFLNAMEQVQIKKVGNKFRLKETISSDTIINLME